MCIAINVINIINESFYQKYRMCHNQYHFIGTQTHIYIYIYIYIYTYLDKYIPRLK